MAPRSSHLKVSGKTMNKLAFITLFLTKARKRVNFETRNSLFLKLQLRFSFNYQSEVKIPDKAYCNSFCTLLRVETFEGKKTKLLLAFQPCLP